MLEKNISKMNIGKLNTGSRYVPIVITGEEKTILFGLTGTGYFDMVAYEKYNNGEMSDYIPTDEDLEAGFVGLPKQPE